jgi:hypothetical protein
MLRQPGEIINTPAASEDIFCTYPELRCTYNNLPSFSLKERSSERISDGKIPDQVLTAPGFFSIAEIRYPAFPGRS